MDYYFNFKEKAAKYSNAIGLLKQHNIPEAWPPKMEDSYSWEDACLDEGSMLARDDVIHFAGYCFLSNNWLRPLASWIGTVSAWKLWADLEHFPRGCKISVWISAVQMILVGRNNINGGMNTLGPALNRSVQLKPSKNMGKRSSWFSAAGHTLTTPATIL